MIVPISTLFLVLAATVNSRPAGESRPHHPHVHPQPQSISTVIVTTAAAATVTAATTVTTLVTSTESVAFVTSSTTSVAPSKRSQIANKNLLAREKEAEVNPHPHPHPSGASIKLQSSTSTLYTTTKTETPTSTSTVVVTPTCTDPSGWNWAHYRSPYTNADGADITYFKDKSPDDQGITNMPSVLFDQSANATFYDGSKSVNTTQMFLDHHAYLRVPTTGQYNFTVLDSDDATDIWVGENAYAGWNRPNADVERNYGQSGSSTVLRTYTAGEYIPIRVSLLNINTRGLLSISIEGPDGSKVPDDDFVQYGCLVSDGAPLFPAWGNES